MKSQTRILVYLGVILLSSCILYNATGYFDQLRFSLYFDKISDFLIKSANNEKRTEITVAVIACGDRTNETLTMVKSAIIFTKSPLRFIVFAEENLIPGLREKLSDFQNITDTSFTYEVHPTAFPEAEKGSQWSTLFQPCAAQRLFLPSILKHVDSLVYVDSDTMFLGPLEEIWELFDKMNSTQMAALAAEHEDPAIGWYNHHARHPYYGKLGVNSGVMLMNLTRMRDFNWVKRLAPIYEDYKDTLMWGDQDIINIIFHFHPENLFEMPCRFNYRTENCVSGCKSAEETGISVIHGSRRSFHDGRAPGFKALYPPMRDYQLGTDMYTHLVVPVRMNLDDVKNSKCGNVRTVLLKSLEKYLNKV